MPLLDHFGPPLYPRHRFQSFLVNWTTRLADALTELLPPEFRAEQLCCSGPLIDTAIHGTRLRPAPVFTLRGLFADSFEVRVFSAQSSLTPAAAIALASPANKGLAEARRAFAAKCATYLHQGTCLIVVDIVTNKQANLHNEIMRLLETDPQFDMAAETEQYALAYRPVLRHDRPAIDVWMSTFAVGDPLPTMPLRLTGDLFVPVDFEATYQEACRRRRLI